MDMIIDIQSTFQSIYAELRAWAVLYSHGWSSTQWQPYRGACVPQEPDVNDILPPWVVPGTFGIIFLRIHIGTNHVTQNWFRNTFSSWWSWESKFYLEALKQPQGLGQPWLARPLTNQDKEKRIMDSQGDPQLIVPQNIYIQDWSMFIQKPHKM